MLYRILEKYGRKTIAYRKTFTYNALRREPYK